MQRFKEVGIILNLENSNYDLITHAKELIDLNSATIHMLCNISPKINSKQKKEIEVSLKKNIEFEFKLKFFIEKPVIEISKYILENNLDIILVKPDYDENIFNKFFHGSLTLSLMRKAPCLVWVIKKPVSTNYEKIAIAIDPIEEKKEQENLNDKLIQIGTSYAKLEGAECHLLSSWHLEGENILEGPFINTSAETMKNLNLEEKIRYAHAFENIQQRNLNMLKNCQTHLLHGRADISIAKFISENKFDLVLMGTVARGGIKGVFIGNTAESLVNQIDCSIMAVKPDGFISPFFV